MFDSGRPPSEPQSVTTFPLERPGLRRRRREPSVGMPLQPLYYAGPENALAGFLGQADPELLLEGAKPLLIVGPPGSGKTAIALHLGCRLGISTIWKVDQPIQSEGQRESSSPVSTPSSPAPSSKELSRRVAYHPAAELARGYATAIDHDALPAWRREIDDVPVLILDDLQFIADKSSAQTELAMRLDAREAAGRVTVITCRRLPTEIHGLRSALVSRTLPGLTVTLQVPANQSRRMLLRELMIGELPEVQPEQIAMLDAGLESNLPARALAAAVKQVSLWCRMNESSVDEQAIQAAINQIASRPQVSVKAITTAVARHLGVRSAELRSGSRRHHLVRARSLAMYLSRQMTQLSLTHIGDA
ncbi:MAG: DnaA/Hda family protein, partial [Planctomycetota bacterium]